MQILLGWIINYKILWLKFLYFLITSTSLAMKLYSELLNNIPARKDNTHIFTVPVISHFS